MLTERVLAYYQEKSGPLKGSIAVDTIQSVRRARTAAECSQKYSFLISVRERTYQIQAKDSADRDAWIEAICSLLPTVVSANAPAGLGVQTASSAGVTSSSPMVAQAPATASDSRPKHEHGMTVSCVYQRSFSLCRLTLPLPAPAAVDSDSEGGEADVSLVQDALPTPKMPELAITPAKVETIAIAPATTTIDSRAAPNPVSATHVRASVYVFAHVLHGVLMLVSVGTQILKCLLFSVTF